MEIFAPNCEFRRPTIENGQQRFIGYDAFAPYLEAIIKALKPISGEVLETFTDGKGKNCTLTQIRGVHSGTFAMPGIKPVPATDRPVAFEELTISEVAGGRIVRQFSYYDLKGLLWQIGAA